MALNDGKTLKLLSGKGKSSRLCTSLSIDRENLFQFFLTFDTTVHVLSSKLLIVWKIFFSSFLLDCKQEIWMVGRQVRLRGGHNSSSWQKKKKEQEIFHSRRWACIFRVKWCTVGMHNAMTRSGLETNSSWDVSRGKEKVPLLQWICWVQKSGLIFFFTFVIMQVVLLNIWVGQRWDTMMKSRLRVT